jgi:DNA polymerase-4
VSVGVAPNKLVAKIASDLEKPDGLVIIPPDQVFERIKDLPVKACPGIGPRTTEVLSRYNIKTFNRVVITTL